jgi:hypothetical protein
LPGSAQGQAGTTGIENTVQIALFPTFAIGGATLHEVVQVIHGRYNLKVGPEGHTYQFEGRHPGISGFPCSEITFSSDGYFDAGPSKTPTSSGARMYMERSHPSYRMFRIRREVALLLGHWCVGYETFSGLLQTIPCHRQRLDEKTSSYP